MKVINWIKEHKLLVVLVLIGSVLRFYKLDFQSPWIDEIFTLYNSSSEKSFREIYIFLKENDPHPPLYYYIIHVFYLIFENTSLVARVVSALFGIAGLFSIYYLAKELINKKVGLIAVALLVVNYFHLYYSQEARMYSMLFFTTTISFLYLIRFIKKPRYKSALLHAVFAAIMIYTHFFALFTLFSQYLILLYFVFKPYNETQKKFLIYSTLSGIVTFILYIPALFIFLQTSKRTSIWIPIPERNVYTVMFKEFFGFSEIVLFIVLLAISYFFIKLFNKKELEKFNINPDKEKQVFTFFVLIIWILITLIIPLIISFINLPMIVSRYFINILPAVIILVATGIYYIKNNFVKTTIISLFVLFSISDIVIVKKYYKAVNRTQFREVCEYVKSKKTNDNIVSSLSYYMSYFIKENKDKIIDNSLDNHFSNYINNPSEAKSFWYIDGHNRPYSPSDITLKFIDSLYVINDNIDLFDCYAKHFQLKKDYKPNINISKFKPFKERNGDNINFSVEVFIEDNNKIDISGWAYFDNISMIDSNINMLLINNENEIIITSEKVNRVDVTDYFNSKFDISNSGFKTTLIKNNIKNGEYKLAIYLIDSKNNKEGLILTDKKININN
jgi:uncharacterized membrane protein